MSRSLSVAIVGAGISGLVLARTLRAAGANVTVFEKARGSGGRLSTRRVEDPGLGPEPVRFDHGAPHFAVSDPRFAKAVVAWQEGGLVAERRVEVGVVRDGALRLTGDRLPRLVGVPTMSALCRALGEGTPLRLQTRVESVRREGSGWSLALDGGAKAAGFDAVAITVPAPQAVPLLAESPELAARAATVRFTGCRALLAAFAAPIPPVCEAAILEGSPLSWISREASKPGRPAAEAWVLQASSAWSDAHEELEPGRAVPLLMAAWREFADVPEPVTAATHRWRYAQVRAGLGESCLFDARLGIGAAGDWCGGSGVEGAYLSGVALAERILAAR